MWIANNDEQRVSPGDGHIETLRVAQEAESVPQVNVHQSLLRTNLHQQILKRMQQILLQRNV